MRAVTFGELLLRLSPPGDERLLESPELHTCFGGAEANVAVALSHLGVRCDYVSRVPDNPLGDAGVEALRKEGVGTRWIARGGGGERLGLYFVEPGADLRSMRVVYDRAGAACERADRQSGGRERDARPPGRRRLARQPRARACARRAARGALRGEAHRAHAARAARAPGARLERRAVRRGDPRVRAEPAALRPGG